jgi:flagellar basal-body rod modification protein FlgD
MSEIPISSLTSAPAATQTSTAKNTLDADGFLKLLIAQLKNQDPSSPMDTQAMMQQTTQLSMMEQLVAMGKDSQAALALQQRSLASQIVGAEVTYCTSDGANATGVVSSVIYTVGEPTLVIGGEYVLLSSVASVKPPSAPGTETETPSTETPSTETPSTETPSTETPTETDAAA